MIFLFRTTTEASDFMARLHGVLADGAISLTVTVAKMLIGLACTATDDDYGWLNLDDMRLVKLNSGYIVDMPRFHLTPTNCSKEVN